MLTLIVCTKGRTAQLSRLLQSLRGQTDKRFAAVIVDQNARGFLDPVLEPFPDLPIIHASSPQGASRARNMGLSLAKTELVGFPDDDCWLPPSTIADVIGRFAREPSLDVVTGRTVDAEGRESVTKHLPASCSISIGNVFLTGNTSSFFSNTRVARAVGGFDETLGVGSGTMFGSGEETEFLLRCLAVGANVHYAHDLVVHHDQVERDLSKVGAYAMGFGRVCRLHRLGLTYFAPRVARAGLRSIVLLARGDREAARARWRWIGGGVRGYLANPAHSEKSQLSRSEA
jgi:glycosyltransferase involved in cell wall biosynthesis